MTSIRGAFRPACPRRGLLLLAVALVVFVSAAGGQDRPPAEKPDHRVGELRVLEGHSDRVLAVAFSSDGKRALSGSQDRTVRLWNVGSGKELCRLEGHTMLVRSVCLSADGSLALSGSYDGTVRLWDVAGERH